MNTNLINHSKMSISNELQTLLQVSSEIDESEVNLTFANQCIKAQEDLANKLREEIQRRKEICKFKRSENQKLEAEIKNAEIEVEKITHKTIQSAKTEMEKELLLTKERKSEIQERIKKGEKKYEDLWLQCKKKYENIPLVKKLTEDKNKCEVLKNDINTLEHDAESLDKDIKEKKNILIEKDQKLIIQFAEFFVKDLPSARKIIREKTVMINKLTKELEDIAKEQEDKKRKAIEAKNLKKISASTEEGIDKTNNSWAIDDSPMMPKLHLPSVDMDVINIKLDINKVTLHTSPVKRNVSFTELEKNTIKKTKPDENLKDNYISCYFSKNSAEDDDKPGNSPPNYSKKKLINIIEDIKIDDNETYQLMAQANIDKLKNTDVIRASKKAKEFIKSANALEIEEIDDVDVQPHSNQQDLLIPPSPFSDLAQAQNNQSEKLIVGATTNVEDMTHQENNLSQSKESNKKKVSFDLPTQESPEEVMSMSVDNVEDDTPNETATSQLNLSEVADENYMAIKDMILKKKSQLDLSPQFVYAKNTLQKRTDEGIITSKFFESTSNKNTENDGPIQEEINNEKNAQHKMDEDNAVKATTEKIPAEESIISMDADNAVSSPKGADSEKPVTGLLFTHGPQGIPDCLDISMSTTGYEEGDPDFPTCLDSSLLLSPKADVPMAMSGNNSEVGSQDLPNFLTGFRKGGLSFFKHQPSDPNPDENKQNHENNFNFNFGSDDKKSKGGLFSFFR